MYLRKKLNREGGFTIAEILVAGFILVFALIPIVRMFDTSFSGIRAMEKAQDSAEGAKTVMEEIRSMPFYEPYNETYGNVDIDDFFWGSRTPINSNPGGSVPDWNSIPEVEFYARGSLAGYESFRIGVQMAYLNDSTGVAEMKDDWGPKEIGKDRPTDSANAALHLVLIKVNAYWLAGAEEKQYEMEAVITDSEAIYNLGISSITVLGPASIQNPDRPNAAAHWSDPNVTAQVEIKGWGFVPAEVKASLVRDKNNDIPITLSYKDETTLVGTMNLYTGGTDVVGEDDWVPKQAIGAWSVRVNQGETDPTKNGILNTYLYEGFVVEYPKPVISDFFNVSNNLKTSPNYANDVSIRVVGGPFTYLVKDPAVRLIRYGDSDEILDQIDGTVTARTSPSGSYGYALSPNCTLTATFDFTGSTPGEYHMQVVNTDEPTLLGHIGSDPSVAVYTVTEVFPEITDVYVFGMTPRSRVAYPDTGNPRTLVIEGNYFNQAGVPPTVDAYLCSDVVDDEPSGTVIQGNVLSVVNNNTIVATFDFTGAPLGNYKVFVRNRNDNREGWTAGAPFAVISFAPAISTFTASADGFYENYYDVPTTVTGACLDAASGVSITNGSVEYDLAGEYSVVNPGEISINLNLIDCSNTEDWDLRVYFSGGSPAQLEYPFDIVLGPARIIASNTYNDTRAAIYILRQNGTYSYETGMTGTARAAARRNYDAIFYVRGKGFPLPVNGQTTLRIWRSSWSKTGNYGCVTDRVNKIVRLTSANWDMNTSWLIGTGDCGISVQRVGDSYVDSYATRWRLLSTY